MFHCLVLRSWPHSHQQQSGREKCWHLKHKGYNMRCLPVVPLMHFARPSLWTSSWSCIEWQAWSLWGYKLVVLVVELPESPVTVWSRPPRLGATIGVEDNPLVDGCFTSKQEQIAQVSMGSFSVSFTFRHSIFPPCATRPITVCNGR